LPGGVIRQRQQGRQQGHGLGVCRVGVSAGVAGQHQEQGRSVGGVWFGNWWQPEAPAVWLAVKFRAGAGRVQPWGYLPGQQVSARNRGVRSGGGVIRQRQPLGFFLVPYPPGVSQNNDAAGLRRLRGGVGLVVVTTFLFFIHSFYITRVPSKTFKFDGIQDNL